MAENLHYSPVNCTDHGPFYEGALPLWDAGLCPVPCLGDDGKTPNAYAWGKWNKRPGAEFLGKMIQDHSTANVGILTGPLSGVTIVDVDDPELVPAMQERFGVTPIITRTPQATLATQPGPALLHFALPPPSRRGAEVARATSCLIIGGHSDVTMVRFKNSEESRKHILHGWTIDPVGPLAEICSPKIGDFHHVIFFDHRSHRLRACHCRGWNRCWFSPSIGSSSGIYRHSHIWRTD